MGVKTWLQEPINRWWLVVAGSLGSAVGAGPLVTRSLVIFAPALISEYDWDRSAVSNWIALFMFSSGIGLVMFGRHIAAAGIRGPASIYLVFFALSLALIAVAPANNAIFLTIFFVMGIAGAAASQMPYVIAISCSFGKHRGLALGLMVAASGLGIALVPMLSNLLLTTYGWRTGVLIMAALAGIIPLLAITFLVRTPPSMRAASTERMPSHDLTYLRDAGFWSIFIAILTISVAGVGLSVILVPMLGDRGFTPTEAALILSVVGLGTWFGRLFVGWSLDWFYAPFVCAVVFLLAAGGVALVLYAEAPWLVYAGATAVGICLGAEADLLPYLASRYFPPALVSRVVGALWLAWAWGGGLGAYVSGVLYDATGSYDTTLWLYLVCLVVGAVSVLTLPPYRFAAETTESPEGAPA